MYVDFKPAARCAFSRVFEDPRTHVPPQQTNAWRAVVRVLRSSRTAEFLRTPIDDISSVLFPAPCRVCAGPLLRLSAAPVCESCLAQIVSQTSSPTASPLCPLCGEILTMEDWQPAAQAVCQTCRVMPPPYVCAVSWASYEGNVRSTLHLLKFEGLRSVAAPLGKMLASAIAELHSGAPRQMTVIAVPLHPTRVRQRGYNQSILLADHALRQLHNRFPDWQLTAAHQLLTRRRATEILFPLTPESRRKMLDGAFRCSDPAAIAGKNILLIDDIMTTGATVCECTKTLLAAGAASVYVATLARAQRESSIRWNGKISQQETQHPGSPQVH